MARTDHHIHSTPDPWRTNVARVERRSRPAGRILDMVEAELCEEFGGAEPFDLCFVPADEDPASYDMWDDRPLHNTPCGGMCRRCLLHDDPGGCIVSEQLWSLFCLWAGIDPWA
jgi:hypothetical protein